MRKWITPVLLGSLLFFGCTTNPTSNNLPEMGYTTGIVIDGSDIYISGNVGIDYEKASYWLNGAIITVNSGSLANGIFRDGGVSYVYGATASSSGRYPSYWTGGSNHTIGTNYGRIQGGYVSGSSLFLFCGYYLNGSTETACYWSNDNQVILAPSVQGKAISILQTNGIQYIAGYIYQGSATIAQLWTNGPAALTLQPFDTNYNSSAGGICFYNSIWYVNGYAYNASGIPVPCYWTNTNTRIDLPCGSKGGSTLAITVGSGAIVYMPGFTNDSDGKMHPTVWTNGTNLVALDDSGGCGVANSIVLNGSDIYCAGYIYTNGNIAVPCWWSNFVRYNLPVK